MSKELLVLRFVLYFMIAGVVAGLLISLPSKLFVEVWFFETLRLALVGACVGLFYGVLHSILFSKRIHK